MIESIEAIQGVGGAGDVRNCGETQPPDQIQVHGQLLGREVIESREAIRRRWPNPKKLPGAEKLSNPEKLPIPEKLSNPEKIHKAPNGLQVLGIAKKRNRQARFKHMPNYLANK